VVSPRKKANANSSPAGEAGLFCSTGPSGLGKRIRNPGLNHRPLILPGVELRRSDGDRQADRNLPVVQRNGGLVQQEAYLDATS